MIIRNLLGWIVTALLYAPASRYKIDGIGSREELPGGYSYDDAHCHFFFYMKTSRNTRGRIVITIYQASAVALQWGKPKLKPANLARARQNIVHFFKTRDFNFPNEPVNPKYIPASIVFDWGI